MQLPSRDDLRGIDVSRWQGDVDWKSVRGAGVELGYIKASEGTYLVDPDFEHNYEGAHEAGLPVGAYHYMNAADEAAARAQAEYFARAIGGRRMEARPAGDMARPRGMEAARFTAICLAFLERVEALTGVRPMIYAAASGARDYLLAPLERYPLWVANYGVERPEPNPRWSEWTGFQYSDTGRVAGIATRVDLDWFTRGALTDGAALPAPDRPAASRYQSGAIYYIVRPGDTLSRIARRFDITVSEICALNDIPDPDRIYAGQVLRLLSGRDIVPRGGEILCTVRAGETLSSIARAYGVSVPALAEANGLRDPNLIYPGQVLNIPAAALVTRPTTSPLPLDLAYQVQPGDTLRGIARHFGADWRELARANGLPDADRIYPGQLLRTLGTPLSARARSFTGYCEVQPGDTLARIARRYGASVAGLRAVNALDAQAEPAPGRILRVQPD